MAKRSGNETLAYPDSLVACDSHTPMINSIGILGWGVGGIEAEVTMLGQPYFLPAPEVVGMKLTGELKPGVTATDLVLSITQKLREVGVTATFVEYFGPGPSTFRFPIVRPLPTCHPSMARPWVFPSRRRNHQLFGNDQPGRRSRRSGRALHQRKWIVCKRRRRS